MTLKFDFIKILGTCDMLLQ